jgi:tripartite-type tricarboxylate transporter receptor subunit TctC
MPAVVRVAWAQSYPSKPVRVIVPFPAGNASDVVARIATQSLSERLGHPFVIDNRPGAGGNIGTEAAAKSQPDGYTIVLLSPSATVNHAMGSKGFDLLRDIAPVAGFGTAPYVVTLTRSFPAKTIPEFIAYAKANPGKINMASAGTGSTAHIVGELFKMMTGIDMVHVPYRSSFLADLISGQVQVAFAPISLVIAQVRSGELRGLAVTTTTRSDALPDVPTVSDFVPGYDASAWYGFGAPRNTPPNVIETLYREISASAADPKLKSRLSDLGSSVSLVSPPDLGKLLVDESAKWGKVIKFAGVKEE